MNVVHVAEYRQCEQTGYLSSA